MFKLLIQHETDVYLHLLVAGYISTLAVILKTTNENPWVNEFECKAEQFALLSCGF